MAPSAAASAQVDGPTDSDAGADARADADIDADVVIVGAGPAGAALALALSRPPPPYPPWRVVLVERRAESADAAPEHAGQTLPGAARRLLVDLGVWDGFVRDAHPASLGRVSCWGSAVPQRRDAFTDPQGGAWRIDRARFEQRLRSTAVAHGCTLLRPARVLQWQRSADRRWCLCVADGPAAPAATGAKQAVRRLRCGFIVDASGRRAVLARQLGARTVRVDSLLCELLQLMPGDDTAAADLEGFSLIAALPDGWCYGSALRAMTGTSAPARGARLVARYRDHGYGHEHGHEAAMRSPRRDAQSLLALLRTQDLFDRFTRGCIGAGPVRRAAAWSACLTPPIGDGWAAVGDAAASFDPLSSQGLYHALYGAQRLAHALRQHDLPGYAAELDAVWRAYRRQRQAYYAAETRWPDATFWQRRR